MEQMAQRLSQARVFNKLPKATCLNLIKHARRMRLQPGEFVVHQGDVWPKVVFLAEGELRWTMLAVSSREHVLFTVRPGGVFWGHSFFDDQPMPASLVVTRECEAYVWSRDTLLPTLFGYPEAMWEIVVVQVEIMRRAREVIYGLAFQPVATRLANYLLDSFEEQGVTAVERDLTLSELAAMVASSPEVICRLLHQFQADGILEVTRARITLHDLDALTRIVEVS
jgi:CRP/FNR family transcriptional regulator